jgi:hypothetical protein
MKLQITSCAESRIDGFKQTAAHAGNRRLAQWRVPWLIEHSTSHQLLWCIDSFVLRNPPLRQNDGENPFGHCAIGPAHDVGVQPFGTVLHHDAWRNAPAHVKPSAGPVFSKQEKPTAQTAHFFLRTQKPTLKKPKELFFTNAQFKIR